MVEKTTKLCSDNLQVFPNYVSFGTTVSVDKNKKRVSFTEVDYGR